LDADDCLEPGFFDGIKKVLRQGRLIYKPSTRGYYPDGSIEETPSMIPWRDLSQANHLIIGCVINKSDFLRVGGFDGSLPALEDWDFFGRMVLDGCKVTLATEAVYGIYVNPKGRNSIIEAHARAFKTVKINFAKNNKRNLLIDHMVEDHEDSIFRQL
jgi:GT2 family glycosyltransferase